MDYRAAIAVSIVGNLVPVPFIVLFIRKIFAWLRTKSERLNAFVTRMEQRALKKSDTVRRARFWGLFLFVAIPLPGTGAWTGSLIAAMLEMRVREAFPPIALGVVTAGHHRRRCDVWRGVAAVLAPTRTALPGLIERDHSALRHTKKSRCPIDGCP